jgi:hypothetical protein
VNSETKAAIKFLKDHCHLVGAGNGENKFDRYESNRIQVGWLSDTFRFFADSELETLRAENEALRARERVLVEALGEVVRHTKGYGELEGREGGARKEVLDIAKQALSAVSEHTRKTWELERAVIDAAVELCTWGEVGGGVDEAIYYLQAHKEKQGQGNG